MENCSVQVALLGRLISYFIILFQLDVNIDSLFLSNAFLRFDRYRRSSTISLFQISTNQTFNAFSSSTLHPLTSTLGV